MSARLCPCCHGPLGSQKILCINCILGDDLPEDTYDPKEEAQADYSLAKDDEDLKQRGVL